MKYSNEETCHAWAHQTDNNASNLRGSIFSSGATIYSYGSHFPMATLINNVVLIATDNYSNTTAKHLSNVRRAVSHKTSFSVMNVKANNYKAHKDNFMDYKERIDKLLNKASKARTNKEWLLDQANNLATEANNYKSLFKIRGKAINLSHIDLDSIKAIVNAKNKKIADKKKREQLKLERDKKQSIIDWCNNVHGVRFPYGISKIYLRINGDKVETSQHANFPKKHAILAWRMVKQCIANKTSWETNGHTIKLGHYGVDKIDMHGNLMAGCHLVSIEQIKKIASELGLK